MTNNQNRARKRRLLDLWRSHRCASSVPGEPPTNASLCSVLSGGKGPDVNEDPLRGRDRSVEAKLTHAA